MVYEIVKTEETLHEGCAQYADWNIEGFDTDTGCGFLVQDVDMVRNVDGNTICSHYYEAWEVEDGKIVHDSLYSAADPDDIYSFGEYNFYFQNALMDSIGHKGRTAIYPKVYWVERGTSLFDRVMNWDTSVKEANGLKSVYFTAEWEEAFKSVKFYEREPFIHAWDFSDTDVIYEGTIDYCKRMLRGIPYADDNFNLFMKEISDAIDKAVEETGRIEYKDIVDGVKENWNNVKTVITEKSGSELK